VSEAGQEVSTGSGSVTQAAGDRMLAAGNLAMSHQDAVAGGTQATSASVRRLPCHTLPTDDGGKGPRDVADQCVPPRATVVIAGSRGGSRRRRSSRHSPSAARRPACAQCIGAITRTCVAWRRAGTPGAQRPV